ncbi:sialate O-acetylesterase [Puniceicoccus vermicola]|uniref:Beta galactosidase jelly roll domain-containing protein n=1 Tax=Puniceicoccus vermicola TaxID=388746 RepID=A0A7X1E521_9BACT|nr:sialate O-acetylesterase [Puniceicoccus vermicola]MBC2603185.1 beta galactosidase jelly roll domain-containing protein [Puniceicoccus vermicola]
MNIRVHDIFGDGMVLQRGINVPIWGTATESLTGKRLTVSINGVEDTVRIKKDGAWRATLPPLAAGGPYTCSITVGERSKPECILKDVLVGDVWVASGQSNMEFPLRDSEDAGANIALAEYPNLRLYKVPPLAQRATRVNLRSEWRKCTPRDAADFSAVGYFFGRELHRSVGVPIGIIQSAWGGTPAEAWTSEDALKSDPGFAEVVADYERELANPSKSKHDEEVRQWTERYDPPDPGNKGLEKGWHLPQTDIDKWESMSLPGYWRSQGHNYSGVFWFCMDVSIPDSWLGSDATLNLGLVDKSDVSYFNGEQVGSITMEERADAWCTPRSYKVPKQILKAGTNRIAVRVRSNFAAGGIWGEPQDLSLVSCSGDRSHRIPLAGSWQFQVEANYGIVPPRPEGPLGDGNRHSPHILFDSMIKPLIPYAIKGVIWYQGESNTIRVHEYSRLFALMIHSWRNAWKLGDFPFYFVQLANYIANEQWAELREAQAQVLAVANTGMATAIDVGDPEDLHPKNKKDVGKRLARHALANEYGFKELVTTGPVARIATLNSSRLTVQFDSCGGGLKAQGKLAGFEVSVNGKVWHEEGAKLDGDVVVVQCVKLKNPKWVRYAWCDSPTCSLYNASDLPAPPFKLLVRNLN